MPAKKTASKASTAKKATPRRTQQYYYRNLREIPASFRLRDDDLHSGRKIVLAARGQRGDMAPVKKDEKTHPDYMVNEGSLFEIITAEEAKKIAEKQSVNQQRASHPALDQIRNQRGEKYEGNVVVVEEEANAQGKAVAPLNETGQIEWESRGNQGISIKRSTIPGTEDNPLPIVPDSVSPEDQAEYIRQQRQEAIDHFDAQLQAIENGEELPEELDYKDHRDKVEDKADPDYLNDLRGNVKRG